jgi:hypothetical protein
MTQRRLELVPPTAEPPARVSVAFREPEVRYLDLDGDGVPDAVRITETRVLGATRDGRGQVVQVVSELVSGIGDDGLARSTQPSSRVEVQRRVDAV